MRILLDECLPRELADELVGHDARTVQQEGWAGLENGELLQRAAATFAAFLTVDKRIQRTQRLPHTLAVITIRAKANRIQALRPLVPTSFAPWRASNLAHLCKWVPNMALHPTAAVLSIGGRG